jgi:hypothetical protein
MLLLYRVTGRVPLPSGRITSLVSLYWGPAQGLQSLRQKLLRYPFRLPCYIAPNDTPGQGGTALEYGRLERESFVHLSF